MACPQGKPEGTEMTAEERRATELAARRLEERALELPADSDTRQRLQQTARVYRHVAAARVDFGWRIAPEEGMPSAGA